MGGRHDHLRAFEAQTPEFDHLVNDWHRPFSGPHPSRISRTRGGPLASREASRAGGDGRKFSSHPKPQRGGGSAFRLFHVGVLGENFFLPSRRKGRNWNETFWRNPCACDAGGDRRRRLTVVPIDSRFERPKPPSPCRRPEKALAGHRESPKG